MTFSVIVEHLERAAEGFARHRDYCLAQAERSRELVRIADLRAMAAWYDQAARELALRVTRYKGEAA